MAKPQSTTHHYIPIFYLKKWADQTGRVVEFSRPYRDLVDRRKYPAATGYETHLYTMSALPAAFQDWLETEFLSMVDDRASYVRNRLLEMKSIDDDKYRTSWARFLLSLMHRNPDKIHWLKEEWARVNTSSLERLREDYQEERSQADPPTYEEMLAQADPSAPDRHFAMLIKDIIDSNLAGSHLINMHWRTFNFHTGHDLLTSDRPLVMTNGMNHDDSHMALAINPRMLFVATNNSLTMNNLFQMGRRLSARYNEIVVEQAAKYVYSQNTNQIRFIGRRLGLISQSVVKGRRVPSKYLLSSE